MYPLAVGSTDLGLIRETNEDVIHVDNDLSLYVVCDGMGGHAAGEVAASTAVRITVNHIEKHRALIERARDNEEPISAVQQVVAQAVQNACGEVYRLATAQPEYAGMGSTLTLFLAVGNQGIMAHVGDTRLYLCRGGEINRLSVDHTMVEELVRSGVLSPQQAENSPYSSSLTRALGTQPAVTVETLVFDILPNDRLLLCSDGLSRYFPDLSDLDQLLVGDLEELPESLVQFAKDHGGRDNISVVTIDILTEPEERKLAKALGSDVQRTLDALSTAFLFRDLSLPQLLRVLDICDSRTFVAGETIIRKGERATHYWVIVDGRVSVVNSDKNTSEFADGDSFGEEHLVLDEPASFSATAATPTTVLGLDAHDFRRFVRRRPWLGVTLLERIARRALARE